MNSNNKKKQEEKSNLRSYQAYCSHYWLLTLMACSRRHHHCCCCCCCCVQLVLLIYSCFSIHSFLPGSWKCINHCQTILLLFHDENVCVAMLHKSTNMHARTHLAKLMQLCMSVCVCICFAAVFTYSCWCLVQQIHSSLHVFKWILEIE